MSSHVVKCLRDEKCHLCIVSFLEFYEEFSRLSWLGHQVEQYNNSEVNLVFKKRQFVRSLK
jgi:hypothetical protein